MNAMLALAIPLLAALWPQQGEEVPEVVRLKVGTEVVGVVRDFDEAKGVVLERVDDGALLDVAFDQMLPEDVSRIRGARGYLSDEPEPILVEAMKVRFLNGDVFTGLIVEQGTETFKLRQQGKVWTFQRSGVREITPVQVDALEVHDPEELYAEELARRNPETALDHYNFAVWCESLQLWQRVKEHLAQVVLLDRDFKADLVAGKLKRSDLRLESGEDSALLAKAQRLASRDQYDGSLAMIDEYLEKKPGSPLKAEFERTRKAIGVQREKWLRGKTIFHFFIFLERAASAIATDPQIAVKEARKQMELEGSNRALEATAAQLGVEVGEVRSRWQDEKRQTASPHYATYGSGTWTLGSIDAVIKGLVKEDPDKAAAANAAEAANADATLEEKIKKLLEQKKKEQEAAARNAKDPRRKEQRGPEIADIPPTEDEWWEQLEVGERTRYLIAWWADHDPHVKIIKVTGPPCGACAGKGILKYFDRSGEEKWSPCPRCKGCQIDRTLRFH